jgi:thymidine kinase
VEGAVIPQAFPSGTGWIEVITGCMYSGKTEELIRRVTRARIARAEVVIFKPATDTRYAEFDIVSHSKYRLPCVPVQRAGEIEGRVGDATVVGIDEAQFFDADLVDVCERLANGGRRVVVAGLDQDFLGRPFEPIPQLLAVAEYITKNLAICTVCGSPADRSQRLVARDARVLLGAEEVYEARCRKHFHPDRFDAAQESLLPPEPAGS